ncbi:MAG: Crp/Fnr family transcriptional regulator [Cyclobacteriaceae bacterium]|nr:Crp/Fnr family transcriptional regulator [Cyclobacteriaceae bacterium]
MAEFISEYKCFDCRHCFKRSPLFSLLSEQELDTLNNARMEVNFKKGEIIYKQGSPLTHLVILNNGFGKIFLEGAKGRNLILSYSKKYDLNGGVGVFIDYRHHSSMMAITDCSACFIDIHEFKSVLKSNSEFMDGYIKERSERVLHTYEQFSILTQKNIEGRMAESLLYLYEHIFDKRAIEHISKKDLGELTAMTLESAIRVLKEFKDEGIIEIENQKIKVLKKNALEKIALHG